MEFSGLTGGFPSTTNIAPAIWKSKVAIGYFPSKADHAQTSDDAEVLGARDHIPAVCAGESRVSSEIARCHL